MSLEGLEPLLVLGLEKNFNLSDLKRNYKKLVVKYHPDKSANEIAATPQFQILTACYKMLLKDFEMRQADKSYHELRAGSKQFWEQNEVDLSEFDNTKTSNSKFDLARFNKNFDENRMKNFMDEGYEAWMAESQNAKKNINKHALQVYREPQALESRSLISCSALGISRLTDYSGDNTAKSLHYSDYRVAHTTDKIIDPSVVKQRKEYKSVDDLEKERAKIRFEMSNSEKNAYEKKKLKEDERERIRQRKVAENDELVARHHAKISSLYPDRLSTK